MFIPRYKPLPACFPPARKPIIEQRARRRDGDGGLKVECLTHTLIGDALGVVDPDRQTELLFSGRPFFVSFCSSLSALLFFPIPTQNSTNKYLTLHHPPNNIQQHPTSTIESASLLSSLLLSSPILQVNQPWTHYNSPHDPDLVPVSIPANLWPPCCLLDLKPTHAFHPPILPSSALPSHPLPPHPQPPVPLATHVRST